MGFKEISRKQEHRPGHNLWDTDVILMAPKKYKKLTEEEINEIQKLIPAMDGLVLFKEDGNTCLHIFDLTKRKINPEDLITKMKDHFWNAVREYNET